MALAPLGYWRLVWDLTRRDLRARFAGSALGVFWSVVQPLLMLGSFLFLFSVVLDVRLGPSDRTGSFALFLVTGLVPWLAFQESLIRSAHVILDNATLVKKTRFPSKVLPIYVVLSSLVIEAVGLVVLGAAILAVRRSLPVTMLLLPVVIALKFLFTVGLAWCLASVTVYVRDLFHVVAALLPVWLYLTPIVYPDSLLPATLRSILWWNPFWHVVAAYRTLMLDGQLPGAATPVYLAIVGVLVAWAGSRLFDRMSLTFSDVI